MPRNIKKSMGLYKLWEGSTRFTHIGPSSSSIPSQKIVLEYGNDNLPKNDPNVPWFRNKEDDNVHKKNPAS